MTAVADYYAKIGYKVDSASAKALDTHLSNVEKRLNDLQNRLMSSMTLKPATLNKTIKETMEAASQRATLRISKYSLAKKPLADAVRESLDNVSKNTRLRINRFTVSKAPLRAAARESMKGIFDKQEFEMTGFKLAARPLRSAVYRSIGEISDKYVFTIRKFRLARKPLQEEVRRAYDSASDRSIFQVSRFSVDRVRLQRALMMASRGFTVNLSPTAPSGPSGRRGAGTNYVPDRMALERLRHENRMELERLRHQSSMARSAGFGAAAGTGMFGAHAGRLPGILGGGYLGYMGIRGIGAMNQANQEQISTRLTTQAVVESYGLEGQGPEAFNWLERMGNHLGFNYMDQAADYNSFLANALGAGQSLGGAQGIYKGFAEYQRAMGVTPARQKLVMSALSQMMGKNAVSMEELESRLTSQQCDAQITC